MVYLSSLNVFFWRFKKKKKKKAVKKKALKMTSYFRAFLFIFYPNSEKNTVNQLIKKFFHLKHKNCRDPFICKVQVYIPVALQLSVIIVSKFIDS